MPGHNHFKENIHNLSEAQQEENPGLRSFDLSINGPKVIDDINLARDYGRIHAVEISHRVKAKDTGINIGFSAKSGKTLLSGVKLERIES